jgi:REP element-mobilizing transposase RayT
VFRTFRLRPSLLTNAVFLYALAIAIFKTGVLLHAISVMSNHHHLVLTDVRGVLPDFLREFHRAVAKALNAAQGQWENLWAAEQTNVVLLPTAEEILDKIAYVAANPVEAGLVDQPTQWPGVRACLPTTMEAPKPGVYFGDSVALDGIGDVPVVRITPAPALVDAMPNDWRQRIKSAVRARVDAARERNRREGRAPLGPKAIMSQSFLKRAVTYETKRGRIPTFAAKTRATRVKVRNQLRKFRADYRRALKAWREGVRSVLFPQGTWWMRVFHGADAAGNAATSAQNPTPA